MQLDDFTPNELLSRMDTGEVGGAEYVGEIIRRNKSYCPLPIGYERRWHETC